MLKIKSEILIITILFLFSCSKPRIVESWEIKVLNDYLDCDDSRVMWEIVSYNLDSSRNYTLTSFTSDSIMLGKEGKVPRCKITDFGGGSRNSWGYDKRFMIFVISVYEEKKMIHRVSQRVYYQIGRCDSLMIKDSPYPPIPKHIFE